VSPEVFICVCVTFLVVFGCAIVFAYQLGVYRGSVQAWQQSMQQDERSIGLKAGQTLVGVMDMHKDIYFFIGKDAGHSQNYE
jgi:hypothetical protein